MVKWLLSISPSCHQNAQDVPSGKLPRPLAILPVNVNTVGAGQRIAHLVVLSSTGDARTPED